MKEYLARVRLLRISGEQDWERMLWPILVAWLWKGEPLLPNLQELTICDIVDGFETSFQFLTFMVPPSLRCISTIGVQGFEHMITFYQLLFSRGCSPTKIEYVGDLPLPPALTLFEHLNTLVVEGPYELKRHGSQFPLPELLQQLPSLKQCEIDLGTLQIRTTNPRDPFEHPALEMLVLKGTTEELYPLLSSGLICPLTKKVSLTIQCNTDISLKFLFDSTVAIFPKLNDLTLQFPDPVDSKSEPGTPELGFSDLKKLLARPMESLTLNIPSRLSSKDFCQVFKAWPKLHTLKLTGGKIAYNAAMLLSTIPYRNLHTLSLPLSFVPLATPLNHPVTQKNPLKHLHIVTPTRLPPTLDEKVVLAQNLFTLLPTLQTVRGDDAQANDLCVIMKGMQAVVAIRSDRALHS